jgi:hypothetical protein
MGPYPVGKSADSAVASCPLTVLLGGASDRLDARRVRPPTPSSGEVIAQSTSGSDRLLLLVRGNKRIHHACLDPGAKTLQQDLRAIGKAHAILEKVTVEPRKGNDLVGRYAKRGPGALGNILKHQLGVIGHAHRRRGIAGGNEPNSAARKTVCHILLAFPRGSASISFQRVVAHDLHPRFVAVVQAPLQTELPSWNFDPFPL